MSLTLETARHFLNSQDMPVTQEWLTGCVEYFHKEMQNLPLQELFAMIKNQWILGDLRDISPGCLPPNLSNIVKTVLNGKYTLQMNSVIDIGTPAYQQLQKISKIDTTNIEMTEENSNREPSCQRILKLKLTDGIQEIHGIEYKPMKNLNCALTPGIKLKITGPIDCRRGVLMLEEKHLIILGGEVEDLLESNNYANILSKKVEQNSKENVSNDNQFTRVKLPTARDGAKNTYSNSITKPNISQLKNNKIFHTSLEDCNTNIDDAFNDIYFDMNELEALENQVITSNSSQESNKLICNKQSQTNIQNKAQIIIDDSLDSFNNSDFDEYFQDPSLEPSVSNTKIEQKINIKYLTQILNDTKLNKSFKVKAKVTKVVGKLSLQKKTSWILKCTITDDSGHLDVDFSNDLLSQLIGYSPDEMMKLKKRMAIAPELKSTIMQALDKAMHKISNLNCFLCITFKETGPCVTQLDN